ncbi:hypothetical protein GCM10028786_22070 [Flaviaesturariibacter terrae]
MAYASIHANAQPTVLGTQLVNGSYATYNLIDKGAVRSVRLQASSGASSGARNWEFATGTAASTNYSTNWRPYSGGQTLSGYNTMIDPASAAASARYNTSFGGSSGLLPAVTSGNYYTVNVGKNSGVNNYMSVLETSYSPVSVNSVSQSPAGNPTNQQSVTVSTTLSGSLNTGEYVFIRWWTDASNSGSSNATIAAMTGSGTSYSYTIPAVPANQTVSYYVFSTNNAAPSNSNADYYTLNLNNNSNSNYTYTVSGVSAYNTKFINGTYTDWTSSDLISNDGSRNAYLTWDDQYFYVRVSGGFGDADKIQVGFDANPGSNFTSSTNAFAGADFTGDLTPDYLVQSFSTTSLNLYTRSSNSWGSASDIYGSGSNLFRSGSEAEFRIARSSVGLSSTAQPFGIYIWLANSSDQMFTAFGTGNYPGSFSTSLRRMRSAFMFSSAATNITPSTAVAQDYNASEIGHTIQGSGYRNLYVSANTASTATGSASSISGNVVLESLGTLSLGNSLTVAGNVTLTGSGVLALNGKDLTAGGTFSGSGLIAGSAASSLTITGTGNGGTIQFQTGSQQLSALTLNRTSSGTLALASNLSVTTLSLTAGTLSNTSGVLTLAPGGSIVRGTGTLAAAPTFAGSSVDVTYNGAGNITAGYEIPSTNILRNLTLNGSATVTLNKAVTVNGTLTLTSGKLDVDAYDLTVAAGSVSGGSTTSYVKTSGAGALHIKSVGPSAQAFPVGNSTYNPLDLSSGTMQGWKVRVEDAIANVSAGYTANLAKAVSRQWDLVPDSANPVPSPGVTATFYYNGTTDVGASFSNATDVQLWHYDATGGWAKRGSAVTPATANGLKAATVSGLTYFSPFALSNIDAPLPVSLLAFTGKRTNNVNELKWITATESNNRGFAIERSADGARFTEVGFVASRAQGGTSTSDITYSYTDASAGSAGQGTSSKWYYRLKQQDLDGQYKYSAVVLLKGDKSGILTLDGIYPNPVKGTASIRLQASAQGGSVVLQLTDMLGKVVRTQSVLTEAGSSTTVQMNVAGLPAGQYHLKAFTANGDASETVTLIKQ